MVSDPDQLTGGVQFLYVVNSPHSVVRRERLQTVANRYLIDIYGR
jgi:hypothetical protein